jgi:hypothetical protein
VSKSFSHVDVKGVELIMDGDKAVLISQEGVDAWIPKSQIISGARRLALYEEANIVIPEWLAIEKELMYYQRVDTTRWRRPKTTYSAERRQRVIERFEGAEFWGACGTQVIFEGKIIGEFETEQQAAIAANAARIVRDVLEELGRVHRWASMMTGTSEEVEIKPIEDKDDDI